MIYKHKTQFYTFVLVRTANLPNDLGGRFDNLTQEQKVRAGKFHFRSASSSFLVIDAYVPLFWEERRPSDRS